MSESGCYMKILSGAAAWGPSCPFPPRLTSSFYSASPLAQEYKGAVPVVRSLRGQVTGL